MYKRQPPGSNIPRIWKEIEITVDDPITFAEWASSDDGGGIDDEWVIGLQDQEEDEVSARLREKYRKFADQMIETLQFRGAP